MSGPKLRSVKVGPLPLPPWEVCEAKIEAGKTLSAIEQFICDHEPLEGESWRQQLTDAIEEAIRQ
jgi:hypothetical protein